jgi:hypothetical protein
VLHREGSKSFFLKKEAKLLLYGFAFKIDFGGSGLGKLVAVAVGVTLVLAFGTLIVVGGGESGTFMALRVTARWCFLVFWLAYAGGPLAVLFGPAFGGLARRGREFGLAFAAALVVHLGLVVWLYQVSVKAPVSAKTLIFFGIGVFWVGLLALLSFARVYRLFDPMAVRVLRGVGINFIAFSFLIDFAKNPLRGDFGTFIGYAPFLALAVAGPGLWVAAAGSSMRVAAFLRRAS